MADGTAALRAAAAHWSLAGDQQLLDLLQTIHQRIISNCNATNAKLEEMSRGLRDASVNLQNVNNKFLALSNTQFVESRVYEDDADLTAPSVADKEPPRLKDLAADLSKLKESLQVLESFHEPLHILRDSDSDTDSDGGDDRLVLKPKDLYSERPLPYIIGSQAWKSKWHAGLIQDESDSDSEVSKAEEVEQYSDSEEERTDQLDLPVREYEPARKQSTGSSSLRSESAAISVSPVRPSPSDVAAELARRLGGGAKVPEREPGYSPPEPAVRTVYKPHQPLPANIFPDEPPPLEESSSDDDIFAELHKTRPKQQGNTGEGRLFDFAARNSLEDTLFGGTQNVEQTNRATDKSSLFEDVDSASPEYSETPPTVSENSDSIKKPVGGISLFGTNKHAESIGAAILRRNRRKSSTSDEESNTEEVREAKDVKEVREVEEVKKERDIFDDLFAKSEKLNKKSVKSPVVVSKEPIKKKEEVVKKKDMFSDIFDDIDDIFSSDIVTAPVKATKKNDKPLFDDDDDLFAEIPKADVTVKETVKVYQKPALIDDVKSNAEKNVEISNSNNIVKEIKKESKSLFDSDSDDGLFTQASKSNFKEINKTGKPVEYKIKDDLFGDENDSDDMFTKKDINEKLKEPVKKSKIIEASKSALFDSDDELFVNKVEESKPQEVKNKDVFDDNDDSLFVTPAAKPEKKSVDDQKCISNVGESKPQPVKRNDIIFDDSDDNLFVAPSTKLQKESIDGQKCANNLAQSKPEVVKSNDNGLFVDPNPEPQKDSPDNNNSINNSDDTLFKSEEKSKTLKIIESITEDIFNDGDELFKNTEPQKEAAVKTTHEELFSDKNNSSDDLVKEEPPTDVEPKDDFTEQISSDMFKKSHEHTENVLRTTRIGLEVENIPQDKVSPDIFNDSDDELFKTAPVASKPKEREVIESEMTMPETPELFSTKTNNPEVFSEIFNDIPPIFEKPKEAKKSKNVNALFDDDSDDEALFFKKDDVVTDEKPDFNTSEEKFGIFFDEPPAIDVDFTQKSNRKEDDQKPEKDNFKQNIDVTDVSLTFDRDNDSPLKSYVIDDSPTAKHTLDTIDNSTKEPKKVGKLKPMNFNINVNTLLPGASPKKKQIENIDTHATSHEDLHNTDKIEPKIVKSISFDDPEILDNKISKERAKIQVKRRPSTRRARKEAVRKSAIDLTDSSFDSSNDNSAKDDVKEKVVKTVYIMDDNDIFGDVSKTGTSSTENTSKHLNIVDSEEESFANSKKTSENDNSISNNEKNKKSILDSDDDDLFKNKNDLGVAKNGSKTVKEVQSGKNSFLDSDDNDDLFNISSTRVSNISEPVVISNEKLINEEGKNETKTVSIDKSFLDSDDNDDLFRNKTTKDIAKNVFKSNISSDEDLFRNSTKKGIETLGKVYNKKDNTPNVAIQENPIRSIFDDFPPKENNAQDENVIIQPKEIKVNIKRKPTTTKSILDNSSDEELFKPKTVFAKKVDEKNLFGDDGDDDDDLFKPRSKREQKQDVPAIQTSKETKTTEPVFVDPLSLFGDEE